MNSKKLILFFNGWAADEKPFLEIKSEIYDIIFFYNYSDMSIEKEITDAIANDYNEITIIAWSFGVTAAYLMRDFFRDVKFKIAVNGTLSPVNNATGINEKIFNSTLNKLSEKTLKDFYRNMFQNDYDYFRFIKNESGKDIRLLINELLVFSDLSSKNIIDEKNYYFNKAVMGRHDIIMPYKNQIRFWKNKTAIKEINASHFPFYLWKTWEKMIDDFSYN